MEESAHFVTFPGYNVTFHGYDLLVFFAFRQTRKRGFARAVKDKRGLSAYRSFLTRGKYCCMELPAIYVRMKAHTAGIFQSNIFQSLTAQAKIRNNLLPKGKKSKNNQAEVILFVHLTVYK